MSVNTEPVYSYDLEPTARLAQTHADGGTDTDVFTHPTKESVLGVMGIEKMAYNELKRVYNDLTPRHRQIIDKVWTTKTHYAKSPNDKKKSMQKSITLKNLLSIVTRAEELSALEERKSANALKKNAVAGKHSLVAHCGRFRKGHNARVLRAKKLIATAPIMEQINVECGRKPYGNRHNRMTRLQKYAAGLSRYKDMPCRSSAPVQNSRRAVYGPPRLGPAGQLDYGFVVNPGPAAVGSANAVLQDVQMASS